MKKAYLNSIDFELAKNCITNTLLCAQYPEYTPEMIFKNSGIKQRFAVDKGTVCTDFAAEIVNPLLDKRQINRTEIDFLIYCTEAPDYIAPASSTVLHKKLRLPSTCGTFDVQFGCSGYTYGLLLAKSLIESGLAKKILFVTADLPTEGISDEDVALRFLFSDAVSMSVISDTAQGLAIGNFEKGTDGNGETALFVANSGFKTPRNQGWFTDNATKNLPVGRMTMDGLKVFRFSLDVVPMLVEETLKKNNLSHENIDLFVFHQASNIILKSLQRKLKIADSKIFNNIEKNGNTVSASIPIALKEALEKGIIKKNMNIMIVGFGIGFSWSATVLNTTEL